MGNLCIVLSLTEKYNRRLESQGFFVLEILLFRILCFFVDIPLSIGASSKLSVFSRSSMHIQNACVFQYTKSNEEMAD